MLKLTTRGANQHNARAKRGGAREKTGRRAVRVLAARSRLSVASARVVGVLSTAINRRPLGKTKRSPAAGDPKFSQIPVDALLSKAYAAQRAKLIDMQKTNCNVPSGREPDFPTHGDTTYLAAVDSEGNMVSLIQSNYELFGSRLVPDGTGFVLQDRGALFSLDPKSPNALAGHKLTRNSSPTWWILE